jgi:CheY-like chemotaxis protein
MTGKEQPPNHEEILKDKRILIVDDHESVRRITKRLIETTGPASVSTASDGQKALELLVDQPDFDLIITDFLMPNMDGNSFLQEIIKNPGITTCRSFILHTSSVGRPVRNMIDDLNYISDKHEAGLRISLLTKPATGSKVISSVIFSLLETPPTS